MDRFVKDAAFLYVTDRAKFKAKFKDNKYVMGLLDEIFLESESRPDLAERIAMVISGYAPSSTKKGYDGITSDGKPVEAKVRCFTNHATLSCPPTGSMTINDVSRRIVDRYINDQPLFIFPYFVDGHLAVIFEVEFEHLLPAYEECLASTRKGRTSFTLGITKWLPHAKVKFKNKDYQVLMNLPTTLRQFAYAS